MQFLPKLIELLSGKEDKGQTKMDIENCKMLHVALQHISRVRKDWCGVIGYSYEKYAL